MYFYMASTLWRRKWHSLQEYQQFDVAAVRLLPHACCSGCAWRI
jgi:hypothetical protein